MNEQIIIQEGNLAPAPPARPLRETILYLLSIGYRRKRMVLACAVATLIAAVLAGLVFPSYEAEAKILVTRTRIDPAISSQADEKQRILRDAVTEEEINSEVELLNSYDLLERVALASGLASAKDAKEDIAKAVQKLDAKLKVQPIRRSNMIIVSYRSRSPEIANRVISNLTSLYLDKHVAVHRTGADGDFFDKQAKDYQQKLTDAEKKLAEFGKLETVAPGIARPIVVQKLRDFEVVVQQTRAGIKETESRIANLQSQIARAAPRQVTAVRSSDNPQLQQQLKTTLLNLELQRTTLLQKFQPTYRPVQEIEAQIRQTRETIENTQKSPLKDETTDLDPNYQWLRGELAKAHADLSSLRSRATATEQSIRAYEEEARILDEKSLRESDLTREAKTQEQNYLLYVNKREEARITDALDQNKVVNVAIAEQPTAPVLPAHSPFLYALIAGLFFGVMGLVAVYVRDRIDPSFHSPAELESYLEIPVIASIARDPASLPAPRLHALTNNSL